MLDTHERIKGRVENIGSVLDQLTDVEGLWHVSPFDIPKLLHDDHNLTATRRVRPRTQRRDLRHLPVRPDAEGPRRHRERPGVTSQRMGFSHPVRSRVR